MQALRELVEAAAAQIDAARDLTALDELVQHRFEIGKTDVAINNQSFDLMKHWRMRLIGIASIHTARRDDANRDAFFHHGTYLHRRRVSSQQVATRKIKRIVHGAGRVIFGNIQSREIVEIILDFRA